MTDEKAKLFFENFIGKTTTEFTSLPQSGSSRKNFVAVSEGEKYIVTYNENLLENEAFFYFSEIFSELKLNTPKIFTISEDRKLYIQQYLGSETLSEIIAKEGLSERTKSLVKQTLTKLFELQQKTENKIDYTKTFEYQQYDEIPVLHDLNYFKFLFVDVVGIHYHKSTLLKEFRKIAEKIENLQPQGLMIRDFQARNIMINDADEVSFIDYQAAMKGPLIYDVVSFLYQAKANFPENLRQEMLNYYFSLWNDTEKSLQLKLSVKPIQLMRYVQVLGVYGLRGLVEKKEHFIKSIDQGIENLYNFAENWNEMNDYPELKKVIFTLKSSETQNKIAEILKH